MTDFKEMRAAALLAQSAAEKYANGEINPTEFARQCSEFNSLTDSPEQILALLDELEGATAHVALLKISLSQVMREADEKDAHIAELQSRLESAESRKPDIYLCRVTRNGEELYSPCGADFHRGHGYYRAAGIHIQGVE
ncbi:hypothetical protein RJ492_001715 [Pluralibacter gergoviae]|uniref:Ead/Ea22-like family protein n=1 Tax=Pluralibacter gergoviae TaxID=61647 RepID=A0AAI9DRF3_PLUGE|nr:hypothetical protein [Pluralibacter gergoviae]EKV9909073.1 hypothetical protein [Pluralibacter gergoviae]EKW7275487.1 hypothetical protein [Pluralibacter gergoviae]ELD4294341.1 hypothetical protein [Pluralibacter gergoviae]ELD4305121.1 hypothetical protein [Pluralibacter gergoviae]